MFDQIRLERSLTNADFADGVKSNAKTHTQHMAEWLKRGKRIQFASEHRSAAVHTMIDMEEERVDHYEDTLIKSLDVETVRGDALFVEIKVEDKKIISQIDRGTMVNFLPKGLTPAGQF